jgi:hypothetical protein
MPLEDSMQSAQTERTNPNDSVVALEEEQASSGVPESSAEEIVTPIEAGAQAQAEHEFETQRKIPDDCRCAIVSVNGKDVDQVTLSNHHRAA